MKRPNLSFIYKRPRHYWQQSSRRRKWLTTILAIVVVLIIFGAIRAAVTSNEEPSAQRQVPQVQAQTLGQLQQQATLPFSAIVEPVSAAPLVARLGGRVTAVESELGEHVQAGKVVLAIDTRHEGNPTQAQVSGASRSLGIFAKSEAAAVTAANIAIELAQKNVELVENNRPLNTESTAVARRQADVAVRQTELTLEDARNVGIDQTIRAADIAYQTAQLAQDQATINRQLTVQTQSITVQQARLNLQNAQAGKTTALAQLGLQRQQLATQLEVAQEQLQLQQVTTPLSGEVTRLDVRVGDFVTPGATVGEVNALAGARVHIAVPEGAYKQLTMGQVITITTAEQSFTGQVTHIASTPVSATGLWQVDIHITSTSQPIHPGDVVTVQLPVVVRQTNTYFIPLKALVVRQNGTVLFTVDANNRAQEHRVETVSFSGPLAEVRVALPAEARIVVEGNRTLKANDEVTVAP